MSVNDPARLSFDARGDSPARHFAVQYIGRPWVADALGPDSFNCWSCFRWVQREHFGRDLPEIPNPERIRDIVRLFRDHPEHGRWRRFDASVENPVDGDAVQMRSGRHPVHIGLWIIADGGKVLHCARGAGVVAQDLLSLADHGWKIEGFYRFAGDAA